MSSTIQNYYFKDMSSYYGQNVKLNISIDELNRRQTEDNKGSFRVVSKDDAATVEISELAREMYGASVNASSKQEQEHVRAAAQTTKEPEEITAEKNNDASYEGLSGVERELKELEDYIASHPADTSIDVLRNGSLIQQARSAVNLDDKALIAAEKEYTEAFAGAAENFADFSMKITYGDYSGNDVSVNDLNFDAIDKMEDIYQYYKEKIQSGYEGNEREKYLNKLEEAYDTVFEEKIINPVKDAYDDKLHFFRPDSEETVKSIRAASTSKESLNAMVSGYVANQAMNKKQYTALLNGTESFYNMANDKSVWHNTEAVKSAFTDSMRTYSSIKEVKSGSSDYLSAKSAADAIAKKISDKYAEHLAYQEERLGLKKDGEDTEWSEMLKAATANASSGMFMIDFSKVTEWDALLDRM